MKKLILIAALVVMSASAAMAQASWGLKGGLNLANITSSDAEMKPSIYAGAFAEWRLGSVVAISPELIYSRQGSKDSFEGADLKLRLNYLNLPVMVKLYLTSNDALSLDLGPQFGYLLNAKDWVKVDGDSSSEDVKDWMNSVDVSFGAGLTYNLGSKMFVQGRYNIGLTEVFDDGDGERNGVIQLGVGCRF